MVKLQANSNGNHPAQTQVLDLFTEAGGVLRTAKGQSTRKVSTLSVQVNDINVTGQCTNLAVH